MERMVRLEDYPKIMAAIKADGAIRMVDGRYSNGFVNMDDLQDCIVRRLLVVEVRDGMGFAVKPNAGHQRPAEGGTLNGLVGNSGGGR